VSPNGWLLSRRARGLPANARGLVTHRDSKDPLGLQRSKSVLLDKSIIESLCMHSPRHGDSIIVCGRPSRSWRPIGGPRCLWWWGWHPVSSGVLSPPWCADLSPDYRYLMIRTGAATEIPLCFHHLSFMFGAYHDVYMYAPQDDERAGRCFTLTATVRVHLIFHDKNKR
jgi:hypothetical protein